MFHHKKSFRPLYFECFYLFKNNLWMKSVFFEKCSILVRYTAKNFKKNYCFFLGGGMVPPDFCQHLRFLCLCKKINPGVQLVQNCFFRVLSGLRNINKHFSATFE